MACGEVVAKPVDYSRPQSWASLPSRKNPTMRVPVSSWKDQQATARADVFYVYPTIYLSLFSTNADAEDSSYQDDVRTYLLPSQASVLNHVGRIYTPFYRQASLWVYLRSEETQKEALDLAYSDVKSAFLYYLKHYNRGRPLFILSHSQGSQMAVRLLQDLYRKKNLSRILVTAYLIGEQIGTKTFSDLKPCLNAAATNCFVTWASVAKGGSSDLLTGNPKGDDICINPLSWRMDKRLVPKSAHVGAVPDSFDRVLPRLFSARCRGGLLDIDPAPEDGFSHDGSDYHESDFNLFFADLRKNASVRLASFLRKKGL